MKKIILLLLLIPHLVFAADNIDVTSGSGNTVGFDDIGGTKIQRVKPIFGADGTSAGDVATSNPFPVQLRTSGGTEAIINIGKAEDAAHSSGDLGVQCLGVRNDAGTALGADGDYTPFSMDSSGALRVTGGGGGTEYTEGATDSSITGTAILWEDTSDTLRAVSAAKPLPVGDAGGSLTVDGTVTVTDGSGALNVIVDSGTITAVTAISNALPAGNNNIGDVDIASGTVTVTDGSGALNVIVDSSALPTGAATAANQVTEQGYVDGIEALIGTTNTNTGNIATSAALLDDTIIADDAAFTPATTKVAMCGYEFDDSSPDSVNEGDAGAVRMSANRNMYTTIRDAAGNERGANVNASSQLEVAVGNSVTVTDGAGALNTIVDSGTLTAVTTITNAVTVTDGSGALNVIVDSSALPSGASTSANQATVIGHVDGIEGLIGTTNTNTEASTTALQIIDNTILVDDAAFTPATSSVNIAGFQADETATDSVDEGDVGAARMTLDRKQIVTDYAHTTGGESNYSFLSTAAVLAAEIKGSAGQVYDIECFNRGANEVFVRLYNQTGAPANTDTANIVWRGFVPGRTEGAGYVVPIPKGRTFSTGIGIRVTGDVADNDTTALAANEVTCNVGYK